MDFITYNPRNKPVEELPFIIGYQAGAFGDSDVVGQLIAQDGDPMGSHVSSDKGWLYYDLALVKGGYEARHDGFRKHYPDGYRMKWAEPDDPDLHKALEVYRAKHKKEEP